MIRKLGQLGILRWYQNSGFLSCPPATLTGNWGKDIESSECIHEGGCKVSILDVCDPRPGISLGERPSDDRTERSNQEEPKQALEAVSGTIRGTKEGEVEHTAGMRISKADAATELGTY